jgi:ureidoglycolate hydrolase
MCVYTAIYRNIEVSFLPESLFKEDGQIIVNRPRKSDDFNDHQVPEKIRLADLQMKQEQKNKILEMFTRKKAEIAKAKTRKLRREMRQAD